MICLIVFFGIASEASAAATCSQPIYKPRGVVECYPRYCEYRAKKNECVPIGTPNELGQVPTDLSSSPNSDPLAPSSGAVAPSIGNPAP